MAKRPTESGWGSDEDDLLTVNDGGISAFRMQDDDEIDEAALLGLDDDAGFDNTGHPNQSGDAGQVYHGDDDQDLLEIQVDPEEEEVLDYEDELDYNQEAGESVHYEDTEYDTTGGEGDMSHVESQDLSESHEHQQEEEEHLDDMQEHKGVSYSVEGEEEQEGGNSESDSNSDGEDRGRLRFKSERADIMGRPKAKSRSDIPDTLEVSAEEEAQINRYSQPNRRDRGHGHRRGQYGGRDRGGRGDNRRGRPMRGGPLRGMPFARFGPDRMGPPHIMPQPLMRNSQPQPLMGPLRDLSPGRQFGNRMPGGPTGPRPLMSTLLPGQVPFSPAPLQPRLQHLQQERLQLQHQQLQQQQQQLQQRQLQQRQHLQQQQQQQQHLQQQQQQLLRPGVPVSAAPRPHKILINPNFRGPVAGGPPVSAAVGWSGPPQPLQPLHQDQPPLLLSQSQVSTGIVQQPLRPGMQSLVPEGSPPLLYGEDPRNPGIQPRQPFSQPQGPQFQPQGPHWDNGPPDQRPPLQHLQQQQPGFGAPQQQGLRHPGAQDRGFPSARMGPASDHMMNSPPGHPGQRFPSPREQNQQHQGQFSPPFNNNQQPRQMSSRTMSAPRMLHGAGPQQQQQQQPRMFATRMQRKPQQRPQVVAMARKLAQQAKMTQQAKASGSQNKNITVVPIVPLKRRSTDTVSTPLPVKVAKQAEPEEKEEPMDTELKKALEKQKQLRELIKKRKEANRRKLAAIRRQELEKKLAEKGLTIEDIEGGGDAEDSAATETGNPPQEMNAPQPSAQPSMVERSQPIKTRLSGAQQPQRFQAPQQQFQQKPNQPQGFQQQQQQQRFQTRPQQLPHQQTQPQQSNQSFRPRFPNQAGPRLMGSQQAGQTPQQFGQQQRQPARQQQPFSPRQPRPGVQRQLSNQQPFQQGQHAQQQQQLPFQQQQHIRPQIQQQQQYPQQPFSHSAPQTQQQRRELFQQLRQEFQDQEEQQMFETQQVQGFQQQQQQSGYQPGQLFQQHVVHQSGDGFQPQQIPTSPVGRGRGMFGQGGVKTVRGRGVAVRGRGSGHSLSTPPRQVVQSSQGDMQRTVLASRTGVTGGAGRGRGGAGTDRVVMTQAQRKGMRGGMAMKVPTAKVVAGPSTPQQVSIDNLTATTSEQAIRARCEQFGPVKNVIMIPSQKKAIVTFISKIHAINFTKQTNRRMIDLSMVSVSLLP